VTVEEPDLAGVVQESPAGTRTFATGTIKVGAGLIVSGAANYVFASIATRAMGPARFAEFNIFWGLVFGLGLGVFFPFEQEVSRRASHAYAAGRSGLVLRRTAFRLAVVVALVLSVLTYPVAAVLLHGTDVLPLWSATALAFLVLAVAYVSRGGLSGRTLFGRYGAQLGAEAVLRLGAAVVLFAVGVSSPWPFALTVPVALAVAVAVSVPRDSSTAEPEPVQRAALVRSVGAVAVGAVAAQSLINLGPVAVTVLAGPGEKALAGSFLAAALIARMPIFAFAAVQAVLIPGLVRAVTEHRRTDFARSLALVLATTAALGALGVLACAVAGPALLHLLAGAEYDLPATDIALLAVAVALYLLAMVLQPAALSLGRHQAAMVPWIACAVSFPLLLLLPVDPIRAVGLALDGAGAVAVAGLAVVVVRGWRAPWPAQDVEPTR